MSVGLDTTAIADLDPVRPGVQVLADLWRVDTSEGSHLTVALTKELAERYTIHAIISSGRSSSPTLRGAQLATTADVLAHYERVGYLLGITPGAPIPAELLDDAAKQLPPSQLTLYRNLTERAPSEASPLPAAAAPPPLRVPDRYNVDVARMVYMLRNMAWILGWVAVALWIPLARGLWFYFTKPTLAEVWANMEAFTISNILLGCVSFVWALLLFAGTHESLFARFNMWPDRGGEWSRDIGVK